MEKNSSPVVEQRRGIVKSFGYVGVDTLGPLRSLAGGRQ
jgi:hypothetical protein